MKKSKTIKQLQEENPNTPIHVYSEQYGRLVQYSPYATIVRQNTNGYGNEKRIDVIIKVNEETL